MFWNGLTLNWNVINRRSGSGAPWLVDGNINVDPATEFIGTIDANDLVFRTGNIERMRLTSSGNFGIGVANPLGRLHVSGGRIYTNWTHTNDTQGSIEVINQDPSFPIGAGNATRGVLSMISSAGTENKISVVGSVRGPGTAGSTIHYGVYGDAGGGGTAIGVFGNVGNLGSANNFNIGVWGNTTALSGFRTGMLGIGTAAGAFAGYFQGPVATTSFGPTTGTASTVQFLASADITSATLDSSLALAFNGNVGIGTTTPAAKLDVNGDLALLEGTNVSIIIGAINSGNRSHLRVTTPGSVNTITGQKNGKILYLINVSGGNLTLNHAAGGPSQILTNTGNPFLLPNNHVAQLIYNTTASGWHLVSSSPKGTTGWELTGNTGTNPTTNFIGTIDNNPVNFRINNQNRVRINEVVTDRVMSIFHENAPTVSFSGGFGLDIHTRGGGVRDVIRIIDDHYLANQQPAIGFYHGTAAGGSSITANGRIAVRLNTAGNGSSMYFCTNDNADVLTERMRITNLGNVGIGTTAPGGQFELSLDQGRKPGTNTWTVTSDARLKKITGTFDKGLAEVLQLAPIRYQYLSNEKRKLPTDTEFIGFTAQEVMKVFPEAVSLNADGYYDFNLHAILIAYVNAFKELNEKDKLLEAKVKEIETLKAEVAKIKELEAAIKLLQDRAGIKAEK